MIISSSNCSIENSRRNAVGPVVTSKSLLIICTLLLKSVLFLSTQNDPMISELNAKFAVSTVYVGE